ncbi:hypothetical protein ACFQBQ_05480 [Granulicella cerasi]|uniref:VWFA-related domain-containing protein n=1 Tax=Granulicella cerasi TaxID=741063 RepID=A0ABW1Z951_9BACT|nr:hypothetical protein [Granulicella cerasi]
MKTIGTLTLLAATLVTPAMLRAQENPVPTTAVISVDTKRDAPVDTNAITLDVNGKKTAIEAVQPIKSQQLEVAILIDDGLRSSFGIQLEDMSKFLLSLPPDTKVMVGYMSNGTVRAASGFITDKEALAKQIRLPFSSPGISASPYFCLSDFVKHWPSNARAARVVLMISNGVDPYNGSVSPLNQNSPYVQQAQEDALRAGVTVYALYYGDAGMRGMAANFSGQSYLQQVASATGGESLYNGTITPPSLRPYLDRFAGYLKESYFLTFNAAQGHEKNGNVLRLKVKTQQSGAKVRAPDTVRVGNDN